MKKTLLMMCALAGSLLVSGQDDVKLTEAEAEQIVRSEAYQDALAARLAVVDAIYATLKGKSSPDQLQAAFNKMNEGGDAGTFYKALFGSATEGERLVREMAATQAAFLKANANLARWPEAGNCRTCSTDARAQFTFLLQNIGSLQAAGSAALATAKTTASIPTCGSWLNQAKVLLCAAGCSFTGPAQVVCGWACWCEFCHDNSVLAGWICPN
ncbi:MAG: hypothetical protein EOO15_20770 [Chitinophagaceae bacterium]|nr:MAG: hypothetical protein EOO15_20770 [Chitinophagaceae bacterium]